MNPDSIRIILEEIGINIDSETDSHFLVLCPFHHNTSSPAATVDQENGFLYCWGAGCGRRSNLLETIMELRDWNASQALRFIEKYSEPVAIDKIISDIYATKDEMPEFNTRLMEQWREEFENSSAVQNYVRGRGIDLTTARYFNLGFNASMRMVITPVYDKDSRLVGVVGRSIDTKRFKNSKNLPSRKTLFNYNKARKTGAESLVIVESNFDAIRAHQAGYPNVVATLGGTFSEYHLTQVNKAFNRVIIGVDVDVEGEKFASRIAERCRSVGLRVYRIQYSQKDRLPHGAKDFGDCNDHDIAQSIRFAELYTN